MQNSTANSIMSTAPAKTVAKRVAKKESAPAAAAAVPAPAPVAAAPAAAAAPVVEKKAKKAAAAAAAPVDAAVAAPVVVSSTPVEAAAKAGVVAPTTTLDDDIKTVTGNLNSLRETLSTLLGQVKHVQKRVHRELKDAKKRKRRVKVEVDGVEVKRAPSIFERPTQITEELCVFLGRAKSTLMSRSEVTKAVNQYVKDNNLKNKHTIVADAPLRKLLSITEADTLTYFNLQKYLNRHYVKAVPAAPVAA